MPERNFYQCDEQSARSGDIDIEEHPAVSIFNTWDSQEDGVVEVKQNPFDGTITTLVIKAASEVHAEDLVGEYINEVSAFYCCDAKDAQNGDIRIEVFLPGLLESLLRGAIYDADDGVFEERTHFIGNQPFFVIVAASQEHAEELMEEFLSAEQL